MNIVDVSEIEVPNIKTRDILATKKPYASSRKNQLIIGASATLSCGSQYALGYQILDVTIGRVLRTMIYLIPFGGIQLAFKTIKKHVENLTLTLVDGNRAMRIPKPGLAQDSFCFRKSSFQR